MNKYMPHLILSVVISCQTFMSSCQNLNKSDYPYSEEQTKQFLAEITKNVSASITDATEIKKQPTNKFSIWTSYPLSKDQLKEYRQNNGNLSNKDNDISDFATYTIKESDFTNEKNEKLNFTDNGQAIYLQEYSLWEYEHILHQNVGIELALDKKFEKLKGHLNIEFEMPGKIKKEVKIPVNLSIYDKIEEDSAKADQ
ncbi:hypothetical protein BFS30_20910 [Pedobacter steynii]|uniref:Lipoprotein n=2 Tax=Pedobacter steynii TaxID=430522 RepID=A0A1D7QQL9_9SPHI|nr:hypothetical protein BFS30_20910 [Pedobacter steynii]